MSWLGSTQVAAGRFSVIVPSFQQGEFLERTLQSLLDQDHRDVEIIVQDGGSTDQSVDILKRYDARLRWESKPDKGQSAAINEGMRKATGEFLSYLNSDDVLCAGALRRVAEFFASHRDADIVYGLADFIDERDEVLEVYPTEPWNYTRLLEMCFICQPACFWRRSVMERHGPFDESMRYAMDYEYWLRVGATTPFQFFPETLARSRCHARAKAFDQASAVLRATLAMLQRYHNGRIPPRWIIGYARDCAEQQLRKGGAAPVRWTRFALSYWRNLQALAPKVTAGGAAVLLRKLGPPYPSACRRMRDPLSYLKMGLVAKTAEGMNGQLSARS
jgi:glycosyltransferase involved in cell wall biosynthesis